MASLHREVQLSVRGGMNDSAPVTDLRPDEAASILNYWITPAGRARVRGGSRRLHPTALNTGAQGYGITQFVTASGTKQLVAFAGDTMYYSTDFADLSATWMSGATGLPTGYWSLATFNTGSTTYLLAANGGASGYVWDGTTWATWSNLRTLASLIAVHNERAWAYTSGALVEAAKIRDHTTWTSPDGLDLYVVTHDGDNEITGLFSIGPVLLVFKRKSTAYIDGVGNSDVIVASGARGLSRSVGCIAPRTLCAVEGQGVMWLSERGFEFYTPGGAIELVSSKVEAYLRGVNWSAVESTPGLPVAVYYPERRAYVCWLPGAAAQNDLAFVYRLPSADQPAAAGYHTAPVPSGGYSVYVSDDDLAIESGSARQQGRVEGNDFALAGADQPGQYITLTGDDLDLATNDAAPAALTLADFDDATSVPVGIGYDGYVRRYDYGDADDVTDTGTGGVAIGDRLRTRGFVFGDPFTKKRGRRIRLRAKASATVTPTVALVSDGAEGTGHALSIAGSSGQSEQDIARVNGRGEVLQVEVRGAGAGTEIESVELEAEILRKVP